MCKFNCIIATGSRPTNIPTFPDDPRIISSTGALSLKNIPKNLLVIGGGYIGLEMGTVYHAFGSNVTVVEFMPSLLPGADADLVKQQPKVIPPYGVDAGNAFGGSIQQSSQS